MFRIQFRRNLRLLPSVAIKIKFLTYSIDFMRGESDNLIYYIDSYNTMRQQVLHYPRLDTVLMVEETIKKAKEYPSKRQLKLALPKEIMYQTFNLILEYLEDSGKVSIRDGRVIWIWNPSLVKKYSKSKLVVK